MPYDHRRRHGDRGRGRAAAAMTARMPGRPVNRHRTGASAGRPVAFLATIVGAAILVIAGAAINIVVLRGSSASAWTRVGAGARAGSRLPRGAPTAVPAPAGDPRFGPQAAPLARSVPVRIRIPAIAVNAPVIGLGLNADGTIQLPPLAERNVAGWYKHGPTPGQQGPAVILGHVDSLTGPSVFYKLKDLRKGETVYVTLADGQRPAFTVDGIQVVPKDRFPTSAVYGRVAYQGLRLITCGGPFDTASGHYLDDIIVYAHRSGTGSARSASSLRRGGHLGQARGGVRVEALGQGQRHG
jgi:LPXTG-site transpeptidase (sortase) family protein